MNPVDTPFTLVTIGFADQVLRLRRKNKTVEEVVRALGRSEVEVLAAHRFFDIPIEREVLGPAPTIVEEEADEGAQAKVPSPPFVIAEVERGDQRSRSAQTAPQREGNGAGYGNNSTVHAALANGIE